MIGWVVKGYSYGLKRQSPGFSDTNYPIGSYVWVDTVANIAYILNSVTEGRAEWAIRPPDAIQTTGDKQINIIGGADSQDNFQYQDNPESLGGVEVVINKAEGTGDLPVGHNTGDLIRYNAGTGTWESCAEPADFKQINLTPRDSPMEDAEGGVYYKSADKSVYICTDI